MIQLTHRYRLAAAHVLSNPQLSDSENDAIFGKCANPNGHGHDYEFEVTVTGPVDATSGMIIAPQDLDAVFEEAMFERYGYDLLNDCEHFEDRVPTTENLAEVAYEVLADAIPQSTSARLVRVRVTETPRNTFEVGELL